MRTAFIEEFVRLAFENPRLFLVVGDLGFSVVDPFAKAFPERFLNAGVAEQNMTGVAAGLASEGYHVFTYSIANFPTLRCLEQIRNDVCYHDLPVTVVAVGAGLSYGNLGYSHHAVGDIAVFRTLPNLTLLSPADPGETRACLRYLSDTPGPSYLRIGKAGEPSLHAEMPLSRVPQRVFGEEDAPMAFVATGAILQQALIAAGLLANEGKRVAVYSMPWIAPLGHADLSLLWNHAKVVTVEEHVGAGGIGEMLAARSPKAVEFRSVHLSGDLSGLVGSQGALWKGHRIDAEGILSVILS